MQKQCEQWRSRRAEQVRVNKAAQRGEETRDSLEIITEAVAELEHISDICLKIVSSTWTVKG